MKKNWKKLLAGLIVLALVVAFFVPLPYYVTRPGSADKLSSLVTVEGHPSNSEGVFRLVTIAMGQANIYSYLAAKVLPYQEIEKESDVRGENETDEEYNVRQLSLMNQSKNNAIQVAYKAAGQSVEIEYRGVYVLSVIPDAPAAKVLEAGDLITAIDGKSFESSAEFIQYVRSKKVGDKVQVSYKHQDKSEKASVELIDIDKKGTPGIGISLVDDQKLVTDPKITIDSEKIGGPSAGLMFTLEIYNHFGKTDWTKGHNIAGTGTIDVDGNVGRIGGIDQKIVAADRDDVEIFFAPDDTITPEMKKAQPNAVSNYEDAVKTAKAIDSKMKVVPVKTFQDALDYLKTLK
ncbi:PDZ domain-containing protein [Listeria rocourtiae]|uniref:SepM family pheromone-processing serine protease n=1 Tax=Listeria rocourtiae TaxID=647910 RepID=UPI00162327FE|nr:SepM family pheromone-processing serine protease [Listeria rocourtiae]MBC1434619.1 PDZ domain-containing protein [Listeria rocourtiae]